MGIRPTYKGLLIDPSIPKKWNGFSVRRIYGNARYDIEVKNPNHVSKGVKEVYLDGKKQSSNVIKDLGDNKTHNVKVVMK